MDVPNSKMNQSSFDSASYEEAYPSGMHMHWWNLARNQIINRTLIKHLPLDKKLLEIGCGTGIATSYLEDKGWNIKGIDTGIPPHSILRSENLILGEDAFQMPLTERLKFEAIALFDVIEHIDNVQSFLNKILDYFPNARKIILTVPARQEIWSNYDTRFGHYRRYNIKQLHEEIRNGGMKLEYSSYFFHCIYPLTLAMLKLSKRGRATNLSGPTSPLAQKIHWAIAQIFSLEFLALPGRLAGTSLIGVAERLPPKDDF